MDHTIDSYLNRQTLAQLKSILEYCSATENYSKYDYIIPEIVKVIEKKEGQQ